MKFAILMLTSQALRLTVREGEGGHIPESQCSIAAAGAACGAGEFQCLFGQLKQHREDSAAQEACLRGEMAAWKAKGVELEGKKGNKETAKKDAEDKKKAAEEEATKAGAAADGFDKAAKDLGAAISHNDWKIQQIQDALDAKDYVYQTWSPDAGADENKGADDNVEV